MLSAGINISNMGNAGVDFIKNFRIQLQSQLCGNSRQMEQCIGGTADGTVYYDGIAKCGRCENLGRADTFFRQFHYFTAGFPCQRKNIPHCRRRQSASRKSQPQRFRHTLHGTGRSHKGTCPLRGTACQLVVTDFIRCNLIFPFLSERYVTSN